jgi:hypothetical protein
MLSTDIALKLRRAGLAWQPAERDCFTIPGGELHDQVFSLNQLPTLVEMLKGQPAITFHGSSEWALDYLLTKDAVWIPSETQLRQAIERIVGPDAQLSLTRVAGGYRCLADTVSAEAPDVESAYSQVLIELLARQNP